MWWGPGCNVSGGGGEVGTDRGFQACLPWAFWDVFPLADVSILGLTEQMFIVKLQLQLSLSKKPKAALLSNKGYPGSLFFPESLFEQDSEELDFGFWASGWKVISSLCLGMAR